MTVPSSECERGQVDNARRSQSDVLGVAGLGTVAIDTVAISMAVQGGLLALVLVRHVVADQRVLGSVFPDMPTGQRCEQEADEGPAEAHPDDDERGEDKCVTVP